MVKINHLIKCLLILTVKFYRLFISACLGPCCRFEPSCSNYAIDALQKHSIIKALRLIIYRLFRCHPWHPGGLDPVPEQKPAYSSSITIKTEV